MTGEPMAKHESHHQARHLSYRNDGDPVEVPLPHERKASHNQGQAHDGHYAYHDSRSPLQPRDRAKVHSREKM
jgi:hypothetical protein